MWIDDCSIVNKTADRPPCSSGNSNHRFKTTAKPIPINKINGSIRNEITHLPKSCCTIGSEKLQEIRHGVVGEWKANRCR